jgi:hypothetical protein
MNSRRGRFGGVREYMGQKAEGRRQRWSLGTFVSLSAGSLPPSPSKPRVLRTPTPGLRLLPSAFCLLTCLLPSASKAQEQTWTAKPSEGVEMHLTREGEGNRIDFDFHAHAGYAIARRQIALTVPANYQFTFRVRGEAPSENLEFKLIRGDDVWWRNRRDFVFPHDWTVLSTKKRQIDFAWGPGADHELKQLDAMEVVVTAGSGGKGTVWFSDPDIGTLPPTPTEPVTFTKPVITFDAKRELGGLVLDWERSPGGYMVVVDGVRVPPQSERFIWLPDADAKEIRIESKHGILRGVTVEPPSWAPTANDFWSVIAKSTTRGDYPRYLLGEQTYWTVVGSDHGANEALVGEDGNVEPFKGGFSIEPFLIIGCDRVTWADVTQNHTLAEGDLPIPSVTWQANGVTMTMTAAVSDSSMLQLHYRVDGKATLQLAVRPFQVNPSTQWLNTQGGVSTVDETLFRRIRSRTKPTRIEMFTFVYADKHEVELDVPLESGARRQTFAAIADHWRGQLSRVAFDVPADPRIGDTIRTSMAYMLIHRDEDALQPGSRSYERAWIRDGALMAATLLRLGHAEDAKRFAEWFAKYQYEDGKVPCCVDRRGADPVPENDSHGELIYLTAEIWRLTRDRAFVERMWPHVDAAARYIDKLRAQNHGPFEGLVTESISHEGYSAKPMHSYWDDLFALQGLEDAAALARVAGRDARAAELDTSAASMRRDLAASVRRTIAEHHIDYIPGCAELGDFDATSTAIAISPLNLASLFPNPELRNTFVRYLVSLKTPRSDYTPYEMRIIGALIRLGDRKAADSLIDRFLNDRRPAAWNGWGEVVRTDPRAPGFIGDMPHAWVASDFVRSMLDAVAFERDDGTLVIGGGIPEAWLAKPFHVGPLPTSSGTIDVRMHREDRQVIVDLAGTAKPPRIVVIAPDGREVVVGALPARVSLK